MTRSHPLRLFLVLLLPALPSCFFQCEPEPVIVEDPAGAPSRGEGAAAADGRFPGDGARLPPARPPAPGPAEPFDVRRPGNQGPGTPASPAPDAREGERNAGRELFEQSETERLLFTECRKRANPQFFIETSFDDEACADWIAFCEQSRRAFLAWCGLCPEAALWDRRAHIVVLHNRAEWDALVSLRAGSPPPHVLEAARRSGVWWEPSPPEILLCSRVEASPADDKVLLLHFLNYLFLHGLAGSGKEGLVPWLWVGFAWHRCFEVLNPPSLGFVQRGGPGPPGPAELAWTRPDDWVELLKRDVRAKQDEDFILFWHKDSAAVRWRTYVKAWSIVRYLTRDGEEKAKFVRFVSGLKTSKDQARALREVYDWTPDDLDKAWRRWIRSQPSRWRKK